MEEFCAIMVKTVTDIASTFNVITKKQKYESFFNFLIVEFKSLGE